MDQILEKKLVNADETLCEIISDFTNDDSSIWSYPNNDRREHIHTLFQYPAMMVPVVQRNLIELILKAQPTITNIFDPFVGAGTVITAGLANGLASYGQDINPLAVLLSLVKSGPFFHNAIRLRVNNVIEIARQDKNKSIDVSFKNIFKWFREDVAIELSQLRRAILLDDRIWSRRFLWSILSETIRLTSNDRTTTYKLHARTSDEIVSRELSPISIFCELAMDSLDDMHRFKMLLDNNGYVSKGRYIEDTEIILADTTKDIHFTNVSTFDLIMTSPPYGDNHTTITYGQHAYLPLQWIDLQDISPGIDETYLKSTQEIDRRSLGGTKKRKLKEQVAQVRTLSQTLSNTLDLVEKMPPDRLSKVSAFFEDFESAIKKIVNTLSTNGYAVWIIGNRHVGGLEIPNDKILAEILERHNVKHVTTMQREIHARRMPRRNGIAKMMTKEQIMIFRKT